MHEKGSHNCKIGITMDLKNRRNALQVGNPNRLVITASKDVRDGRLEEALAHYKFQAQKIRGEWYKIAPHTAKKYCENKLYVPSEPYQTVQTYVRI